MQIQVKSMKRCELVSLSGEIDSAHAQELEQKLLALIEAGTRNMVLSFRDVTFMSSPGIKALLAAQIKARRKVPPCELVISELSPKMQRTFELVGLQHLFKFYEQDAQAVGSF